MHRPGQYLFYWTGTDHKPFLKICKSAIDILVSVKLLSQLVSQYLQVVNIVRLTQEPDFVVQQSPQRLARAEECQLKFPSPERYDQGKYPDHSVHFHLCIAHPNHARAQNDVIRLIPILLCAGLTIVQDVSDAVTVKDIEVAGRVLAFTTAPLTGNVQMGIVYDPANAIPLPRNAG